MIIIIICLFVYLLLMQYAYVAGNHINCDKPFDGLGGELAHSWAAGDIHFDDDEDYRSDQQLVDSGWTAAVGDPASASGDGAGISLQKLAVHEVGHVLGLLHNDIQHSIMYPIYVSPSRPEDFELPREDRQAVQQIYGVCKVPHIVAISLRPTQRTQRTRRKVLACISTHATQRKAPNVCSVIQY